MQEGSEKRPNHPELYGCRAGGNGDYCAIHGCFYEGVSSKIKPSELGVEGAEETHEKLEKISVETGCIKLKKD